MPQIGLKRQKSNHYCGLQEHRHSPEKLHVYGGYKEEREIVQSSMQLKMNSHSRQITCRFPFTQKLFWLSSLLLATQWNTCHYVCHIYLFMPHTSYTSHSLISSNTVYINSLYGWVLRVFFLPGNFVMFLIQSLVVLSDFELSPNMNTTPESIHILKMKM